MAWTQIMPVRMNPAGKTLSGSWTVPNDITSVAVRLIMDQVDREDPAKIIRIEVVDDATGDLVAGATWQGGTYNPHLSDYPPPNFRARWFDANGQPVNLGGRVWNFSVDVAENTRYGAEMELL